MGMVHAVGYGIRSLRVGVPLVTTTTLVVTMGVIGLLDSVVASIHKRADQGSRLPRCTAPYTF